MSRMGREEVDALWEALEKVPRLPTYATRAIDKLRYEMRIALEQEAKYRSALDTVKTAVKDVAPWDNALPD